MIYFRENSNNFELLSVCEVCMTYLSTLIIFGDCVIVVVTTIPVHYKYSENLLTGLGMKWGLYEAGALV